MLSVRRRLHDPGKPGIKGEQIEGHFEVAASLSGGAGRPGADEARAMMPVLRETVIGGVLEPDAMDIDVDVLLHGFLRGDVAIGTDRIQAWTTGGASMNKAKTGTATLGFSLFETHLGHCGVAWGEHGLTGVQLPEGSESLTRDRMVASFPGAPEAEPPDEVRAAMARIGALLDGEPDDLRSIALDLSGVPPFHKRVYELVRGIAPGRTMTYGEVAVQLGQRGAARAVGQALGHNPFAPVVPCHRILAAGSRPGGFSANGGAATKLRMLRTEGVQLGGAPGLLDNQGGPGPCQPTETATQPDARHAT